MSNEAEDPIVVCIKVYHTQTKELDTKSFAQQAALVSSIIRHEHERRQQGDHGV